MASRDNLERGRIQSGLGIEELWLNCLGMGSNASVEKLQAFFDGTETPSLEEYDLVAQCLNEQLKEIGVDTLVPYGDELEL